MQTGTSLPLNKMEKDTMPKLRLMMNPLVTDKNMILQRKCETFCKILDKDFKSTKRKMEKEAENCVKSVYTLMLEAVEHENDRKIKNTTDIRNGTHSYTNSDTVLDKQKQKSATAARPITAIGYGKRQTDVATPSRPYSANPRIQISSHETKTSKHHGNRKQSTLDEIEEVDLNTFFPASGEDRIKPGTLYKERRLYWNMPIYTDQKTEEKNNVNKLDQKKQRSETRESSTVKPSRYVTKHDSYTDLRDVSDIESSTSDHEYSSSSHIKPRPKTAADYRRKQPEDEQSQYWTKRINKLINKWDIQDEENCSQNTNDSRSDSEIKKRLTQTSPVAYPEGVQLGEAARRKQQFLQSYGKRYMFALKVDPATVIQSKYKRPVIITRQELASIHADLAKKRNQTRLLLRKSKRIVMNMTKLTESK